MANSGLLGVLVELLVKKSAFVKPEAVSALFFFSLILAVPISAIGQGYYYHSSWGGVPQMPTYQSYNPNQFGSSAYYHQQGMNSLRNQGNWIAYQQDMQFYNIRKSQQELFNNLNRSYSFDINGNIAGINTIESSTKNPDIQKNDPDAKSGLFSPKDPNKACLVVMRPKSDWAIVDWDIKLNEKKYDSIEAQSSRVLEVPSGEYTMTCGSVGIGSCIKFKASSGSTHYITAEWERFAVLPSNEGEALFKELKNNRDRSSKLTPIHKPNTANQGAYSTR